MSEPAAMRNNLRAAAAAAPTAAARLDSFAQQSNSHPANLNSSQVQRVP